MAAIPAYGTEFDLSATVSFFDGAQRVSRRTFYLRNLAGESLVEQSQEASRLLTSFAKELHYITGAGIDKISLQSGRRKVNELVVGLEPRKQAGYFRYAVTFRLTPAQTYVWRHETGLVRWRLPAEETGAGWERVLSTDRRKGTTFSLPCHPGHYKSSVKEPERPFFLILDFAKKRRKTTGWTVYYDQKDPVYVSFATRFHEEGNLAVGERRYFGQKNRPLEAKGTFVPRPKAKPPRIPRKSVLASQPTDDTDYVYVIRMGRNNVFKIGKTNDPRARLISLQTASPFKLTMTNVFQADNASAAEETLHAALMSCRLEGEWFRLTNEQKEALAAVERFEQGKFVVGASKVTAGELLGG